MTRVIDHCQTYQCHPILNYTRTLSEALSPPKMITEIKKLMMLSRRTEAGFAPSWVSCYS
jgi:hypothetical protein